MNANTNLNVLGGILDAMLANLVEMIDKRVEAKHDEKMQTLWNDLSAANTRIERLETDLKAVEGQLYDLKNATPTVSQPTLGVAVMDLQSEEFRLAVIKVIDQQVMEDTFLDPLVEAITDSDKFNDKINEVAKEAADSAADEALDNHTSDYDHDDIHPVGEIDEDAVREVVDERLENVTISIKI